MPKVVKKVAKKTASKTPRVSGLSVPVYSLTGRASGTLSLPKEIFGKEVKKKLLVQAIRVYMTNQKVLPGKTKTRGEVEGSTAKIYNQKGTGRARHGSIRAPIFVGGGITFGPQGRKVRLELPQKMRRAALNAALSAKLSEKEIIGISGLEKATGKTKEISELFKKIARPADGGKMKSALIMTGEKQENAIRAVKNIPGVDAMPANLINAFEVLKHNTLIVTKEGIERLLK